MNASNAKLFLPLVQALAEGKTIQQINDHGKWIDIKEPVFSHDISTYRIKPEPREFWVNEFESPCLLAMESKEAAERAAWNSFPKPIRIIHVREVI